MIPFNDSHLFFLAILLHNAFSKLGKTAQAKGQSVII